MASKAELRDKIVEKLKEMGSATFVIVDRDIDEFCRAMGIQDESRTQVTKALNSLVYRRVLQFQRYYLDELGNRCERSGPHSLEQLGVERHYRFPVTR